MSFDSDKKALTNQNDEDIGGFLYEYAILDRYRIRMRYIIQPLNNQ